MPVNVMTLLFTTDNLGVRRVAVPGPALRCAVCDGLVWAGLGWAVLCCAALCCAELCCAVLWWPLCLTVLITRVCG